MVLPKTSEPVNHVTTYHTEDYHIPLEHARHPYLTMLHVLNEKKIFFLNSDTWIYYETWIDEIVCLMVKIAKVIFEFFIRKFIF
jgi:hypothetical protein